MNSYSYIWAAIDNYFRLFFALFVTIIFTRILEPTDFGLIAIATLFTTLCKLLVDSGFGVALIRENVTDKHYSTVYVFNVIVGFILVILLNTLSKLIADFYNQIQLIEIIRAFTLIIFFESISSIHRIYIIKTQNFKLQSKITVLSMFLSFSFSVVLVYYQFGIWALITYQLMCQILQSMMYLYVVRFKDIFCFDWIIFKNLYEFSYKLLLSGVLNFINNFTIQTFVAKNFSLIDLGYYSRAEYLKKIPNDNLANIISKVSYSEMSELVQKKLNIDEYIIKLIKNSTFITVILNLLLILTAKPMFLLMFGEKWMDMVPVFQLMCFSSIFLFLNSINLKVLQVYGYSGRFLKLELVKMIFIIPLLLFGYMYGFYFFLIFNVLVSFLYVYVNSYYTNKLIGISFFHQVKIFFQSSYIPILSFISVLLFINVFEFSSFFSIFVIVILFFLNLHILSILLKFDVYENLLSILIEKYNGILWKILNKKITK